MYIRLVFPLGFKYHTDQWNLDPADLMVWDCNDLVAEIKDEIQGTEFPIHLEKNGVTCEGTDLMGHCFSEGDTVDVVIDI